MSEEAVNDVSVEQEAPIEETNLESTSNETTESNDSASTTELLGSGDWFDPESAIEGFKDLKPEEQERYKAINKAMASNYNEKMRSLHDGYRFKDVGELQQLIQNTPELMQSLQQLQQSQVQTQEMVQQHPAENIDQVAQNWNAIPDATKAAYVQQLTPEQRLVLSNAVQVNSQNAERARLEAERLDAANVKEFGPDYTDKKPQLEKWLRENSKNAQALIYKAMTREEYGQKMYEKGKNERAQKTKQTLSLSSSGNSSSTKAKPSSLSPKDDLLASMKELGLA